MNILHYIIGILIAVIIALSISLYKVCADRNEAKRSLRFASANNDEWHRKYKKMHKALFEVIKIKRNTPEDCKLGPWCECCMYVKRYTYSIDRFETAELLYCGKEEACKHFVQKEADEK